MHACVSPGPWPLRGLILAMPRAAGGFASHEIFFYKPENTRKVKNIATLRLAWSYFSNQNAWEMAVSGLALLLVRMALPGDAQRDVTS